MALKLTYSVKTQNNIDLCSGIVKLYCTLKGIKLSNKEVLILSTFILEGYNKMTKEKLIETKMVKNHNAMGNLMYKFRRYGFFVQVKFKEELHQDLYDINQNMADLVLINIVLDNR